MSHLDLVKLTALMKRSSGQPEIMIGLLDGPVATNHPAARRGVMGESRVYGIGCIAPLDLVTSCQ